MKCKIFTGSPAHIGGTITRWLEDEKMLSSQIVSVTQSFEETHGNIMITIIYTDIIELSNDYK